LGKTIEQVLNVRNSDIAFDPELLVDFANCKYKAVQRIKVPSCPSAHSEIEAIQRYRRARLKERWHPTTNDGYGAFNGTLSSSADFRALSSSVFEPVQ